MRSWVFHTVNNIFKIMSDDKIFQLKVLKFQFHKTLRVKKKFPISELQHISSMLHEPLNIYLYLSLKQSSIFFFSFKLKNISALKQANNKIHPFKCYWNFPQHQHIFWRSFLNFAHCGIQTIWPVIGCGFKAFVVHVILVRFDKGLLVLWLWVVVG